MPDTATRPTAAELRDQLLEAGDKLRDLRERKPEDRGDTWADDMRSAISTIHALDAEHQATVAAEIEKARAERTGPRVALLDVGEQRERPRSIGEFVAADEGYAEFARSGRSGAGFHEIEVRGSLMNPEFRALLDSDPADGGVFRPVGQPLPPNERRQRLFLRDLIAVQDTGLASVPYIRELNALANEGGATAVAEGAPKPEVTMQFEQADAPARKIAAWIPATTEIIDDAATLRGYIDTRLAYMLALREEAQALNGNGTAPNLRGIRQTTGLQTQAAVAGDRAATLGLAIGKVEGVDGDADGIVMNPTDFWTMLTTRHTNQLDGGFGGGLPFGGAVPGIWGLPVVRTRGIEAGKALVGAFRLGATLFDRQETVIRVGNQHSDYFTNNKVAILAEERVALAVHRPDFFVEATLA